MTLYATFGCTGSPGFAPDVVVIDRRSLGIRTTFRRIRGLRDGDAIVLDGSLGAEHYLVDLLFGIYLAVSGRRIGVLLSDVTWHPRTVRRESRARFAFGPYSWLQKRLLLLCDSPRTHYCFLSTDEVEGFVAETKVERDRVHFTPFGSRLPADLLDELRSIASRPVDARVVFAGGNSLRDYDTLIAAAAGLDARFVIGSSNHHAALSPNVDFGHLERDAYFRSMARASIVVVPILPTKRRSVGQQTYLNAMALGKLVIASDVSGVRDHATPGEDLIVVPPEDPRALESALRWALDPTNALDVERIARNGRLRAERMTFAHYCADLGALLARVASLLPRSRPAGLQWMRDK